MKRRKRNVLLMAASVACLLVAFAPQACAQPATPEASPTPSPPACAPLPSSCRAGTVPGVLKLAPDQSGKLKLARQQFYLSSCPFDLTNGVDLAQAPSRKSYYGSKRPSPQLIAWLEANDCDTVYCRELSVEEVACKVGDKVCVPEFVEAYNEAHSRLKNTNQARKWVTMYGPLANEELRVGLSQAKRAWLETSVKRLEGVMRERVKAPAEVSFIRSAIADDEGEIIFYDLCPTAAGAAYYFSSVAPIENSGKRLYWDSIISNRVSDVLNPTTPLTITLAFPSGDPNRDKDGQKKLVGKPVTGHGSGQNPSGP